MRWRIETEVIGGEGQFTCGEKRCLEQEGLRTWEMNFSYLEQGVKKNALVKLRLCHNCSYKVNYHHKRREVTKLRKRKHREDPEKRQKKRKEEAEEGTEEAQEGSSGSGEAEAEAKASLDDIWKGPAKLTDEKSRDDEFEEYLEDLFL
ncbi:Protein FRA10AC1 [Chionoecetes opilio]|uniref:Protein FRA10AC1 n=1 Tax=Chionoecetes opilio TaxID=41210 RepID=A0A8J4YBN8_CHIOP|nr:Protein FRA10AC1 [Chionoecetes opilio]